MPSSDTLFRETVEFNPIIDIGSEAPPQLTKLISTSPNLKVYTRSSPHFQNLKAIWNLQYTTNEPLALIRATNTSDVSAAVKYCVSNKIQFTVRSGGHDLWGRSVVPDAVILDIRELNQIILAEDRKSVIMGGGAQTGPLVDFLDSKGLVTPCTLAGIVGHLGWAFMGGFGPLVNTFGLGVDQIIGAKIVTADGEVKEADSELLWGIKGAGGAFGVITEVTIKTYELPKLLGGMLMFQFDQAEKIIAGVKTMLETETIPTPLSLGFHFSKRGGVPVLSMMFSWVSTDVEEGRKWLHRIKNFGTVVTDMVGESMLPLSIHYLAPS
jgi:FAD/FMN-containing dehydrogenase